MSTGWIVIISILALLAAIGIVSMVIDNRRFVVRDYRVSSPKVREDLTFVFVTDLHSKSYGEGNQKLLNTIAEIHPDAVLCGGDLIISREARQNRPHWMDPALSLLSALSKNYPVYLCDGNHEDYLLDVEGFLDQYEAYCRAVRRAGVVKLHNQSEEFFRSGSDTNVRITGLDLPHETYQKIFPYDLDPHRIPELLGPADPERFTLVLAHNPKYFPQYARWGADLVLSGHVHGGLLRLGKLGLIGPDLHLFPRYSGGRYELPREGQKPATMIVSCGLGSHTLPIRIFNPGELTVVHLTSDGREGER